MVEFNIQLNRFRDKETGEFMSAKMFKNIAHAAATIARFAKKSIKRSKEPSVPGKPPHTRRGLLPRAIRFDADRRKNRAIIGPRASVVGQAGAAQEFGGRYKEQEYPERSFMRTALEKNVHRFGGRFSGSVGG